MLVAKWSNNSNLGSVRCRSRMGLIWHWTHRLVKESVSSHLVCVNYCSHVKFGRVKERGGTNMFVKPPVKHKNEKRHNNTVHQSSRIFIFWFMLDMPCELVPFLQWGWYPPGHWQSASTSWWLLWGARDRTILVCRMWSYHLLTALQNNLLNFAWVSCESFTYPLIFSGNSQIPRVHFAGVK